MQNNLKILLLTITIAIASPCMAYEDRFDAPSANWQRATLLDHGSAEWSISGGRMNLFTGISPSSDNQVLIKYQTSFSNSQNWSFQIGMNNASTAQLQVFVSNADYSDAFGVTLKGYSDGSKIWGAEYPGPNYWLPGGITATASQQGSIKVDYASSTGTYSLFYANGGIDPISNSYSWTLLNSYVTSERGNVDFYAGINTGEAVTDGQAYVDNFKAIPEPSVLSLGMFGLAALLLLRRRRQIIAVTALTFIFFLDAKVNATTIYDIIDPNLSHQLVTVQSSAYVPYEYKISLNMTTLNDWLFFLNSKAKTSDSYGLFKGSDFSRTFSNGEYSYSLLNISAGSLPVRGINLYDAYRYANWVENGANNLSDTETGSYNLLGLSIQNDNLASRSGFARIFIQSNDEWQQSLDKISTDAGYDEWTDSHSYYNNGALIVHNDVPAGLSSQISTYADGPQRAGGFGGTDLSFRIVSVPEPSALSLLAIGLGGLAMMRRRRS